MFGGRDGPRIVTPGRPDESELIRRITAENLGERMPPADSGRSLTIRQIELLRRWIEQGADWETHWAFVPPQRPEVPSEPGRAVPVRGDSPADGRPRLWIRTPIDAFIRDRLQREGLSPSPEADKVTLIRRVTLDLTGLPPTPDEVDDFLADDSPDAYGQVVDRLLASPRYGERMAVRWLDAARYADTNGYQNDGPREMWRWRDWVIDAYNAGMPFDQFTIEQLAGDLLPQERMKDEGRMKADDGPKQNIHPSSFNDHRLQRLIATGFNRNHRGNAEGGIVPEEYAVEYVVDRVETTATIWMGLTLGCARCHDHKYDPFTQREFYQFFAYFNNVPEHGRAIKIGNSPPFIPAPTRDQQQELAELDARLAVVESQFDALGPRIAAAQAEWEAALAGQPEIDWTPSQDLIAHFELDG
ncbi:MAG: DUF1549 domain-containing protein, partial [Planctomycetaceae bacterium]